MAVPNILLGLLIVLFFIKKDKVMLSPVYIKLLFVFTVYLILKAFFLNSLVENLNLYKFILITLAISFLMFNIKNIAIVIKGYVFGVFLGVELDLGDAVGVFFVLALDRIYF